MYKRLPNENGTGTRKRQTSFALNIRTFEAKPRSSCTVLFLRLARNMQREFIKPTFIAHPQTDISKESKVTVASFFAKHPHSSAGTA